MILVHKLNVQYDGIVIGPIQILYKYFEWSAVLCLMIVAPSDVEQNGHWFWRIRRYWQRSFPSCRSVTRLGAKIGKMLKKKLEKHKTCLSSGHVSYITEFCQNFGSFPRLCDRFKSNYSSQTLVLQYNASVRYSVLPPWLHV